MTLRPPIKKSKEATRKKSKKFSDKALSVIEDRDLYSQYDNLEVKNTLLETFKFKQFARNHVLLNGDYVQAFIKTYGEGGKTLKEIVRAANEILEKPEVQLELRDLLPTDHELNEVLRGALETPTPGFIRWAEKHQFFETALKLRGYLSKDSPAGVNVQINNLINDDRLQKIARRVIDGNTKSAESSD